MAVPKYLIALTICGLVDAISYMLVTPSLVFYVRKNGGDKKIYGAIMSAFSFSSFCFKPLLGWWSDKSGFRIPYLVSISVALLGGVVYVVASALPQTDGTAVRAILASRLLSGCGAANSALAFAYIARSVPVGEQTYTTGLLSLCRILGMAIGPGLNVFVAGVDLPVTPTWALDPLNSVGLVLVAANLASLLAIAFFLEEPKPVLESGKVPGSETTTTTTTSTGTDTDTDTSKVVSNGDGGDGDGDSESNNNNNNNNSSNGGAAGAAEKYSISDAVKAFFSIDILVPMLSIFTFNSNFQLIETGFAPAANDALGWGTVQTSVALGSLSFLIGGNMANVMRLSKKGVPDLTLLSGGLMATIVAYTSLYLLWVKNSTLWHFYLPILVGASSFPYMAPTTRSLYTAGVDSKPQLKPYQGFLQAVLGMAASVAGFTTPGFVAAYVLRTPKEVEASSDQRELTVYSLYAPALSGIVLLGLVYSGATGAIGGGDGGGGDGDFTRPDDKDFDFADDLRFDIDVVSGSSDQRESVSPTELSTLVNTPSAPRKRTGHHHRRRSSFAMMVADTETLSMRQRRSSNIEIMLEATQFDGLINESIR